MPPHEIIRIFYSIILYMSPAAQQTSIFFIPDSNPEPLSCLSSPERYEKVATSLLSFLPFSFSPAAVGEKIKLRGDEGGILSNLFCHFNWTLHRFLCVFFKFFLFSLTHSLQAIQFVKRLCTHASGGSFLLVLYTTNSKGRSQEVRLEAFTLDRDSVGKGTIYAV